MRSDAGPTPEGAIFGDRPSPRCVNAKAKLVYFAEMELELNAYTHLRFIGCIAGKADDAQSDRSSH